jgi:hypothetical protein
MKRPSRRLRYLGLSAAAALLTALLVVFVTGDAGLTQRLLNGIEARALAGRSSWLNDGLIHVAYSEARKFTSYGEAAWARR